MPDKGVPWSILELFPLHHSIPEVDRPAVDDEGPVALVVERPTLPALRVYPNADGLQDEEVVLRDHARVRDPAFDVGQTLGDPRRLDDRAWYGGQAKLLE